MLPKSISLSAVLEKTGIALVAVSVFVLFYTFYPVIQAEVGYQLLPRGNEKIVLTETELRDRQRENPLRANEVLVPVDEAFGIVIPKIEANARVIQDVSWTIPSVYQEALSRGVAHAEGTALPGEEGNVFLFSHSGVDFLEANRYNALFYLIDKLVAGDEIILMFEGKKYRYEVTKKEVVSPERLEYLKGEQDTKMLTLMTCTPAGTTLRRLVVLAKQLD